MVESKEIGLAAKGSDAGMELEARFQSLASRWRRETGHLSSVSEMASHPAYQEIIRMGTAAVPLLLRSLREESDHWFYALGAIAGVDPVPAEAAGDVPEMARAWLRWGEAHGHLP